jgi:AcrR family transcriptional regulator
MFVLENEIVRKVNRNLMPIDDTRDKILKVAVRIFSRYGFQKTTMDEIARTAHKAKGSVYYYFNSKEDLFRAVVQYEINEIKSGLTRVIIQHKETTAMIKEYLLQRMYLMKFAVNYHETLKADFTEKYEFLEDIREEFFRFEMDILKAILDKGVEEKALEIKDTTATANVIILAMRAIEIPFYLQKRIGQYENTITELLDILIKGLEKN